MEDKRRLKLAGLDKLPEGWSISPLEDIFDILDNQRVPLSSDERHPMRGDIPYYGANGVVDHIDKWLFDEPLLLMAEDGGNFDDFETRPISYQIKGKSWVNNHAHVLRIRDGNNLEFFFQLTVHRDIRPFINGSTRTKLNQQDLRGILLPVPPREIQDRIAYILKTLDEVIKATRAVTDQTRRLKTALLQDLLTNGLPGQHKNFKKHKYLHKMPAAWESKAIGDVCVIELGKMLSKAVKTGRHYRPYLGNSSVLWGHIDLTDLEEMDIRDDELERYSLQPGDILICEGGEVGRTAIWEGQLELCCYQKALHRLRPLQPNTLVPDFMRFFMEHAVRNNLLVRFTGESSIAHLTRETLINVPMVLPPFAEQEHIVAAIKSVEMKIKTNEIILDQLVQLKSALSQGLLTCRIPVNGGK